MRCESCYEEIPRKRLAAVPNARYCVQCQPAPAKYVPPAHVMAALSEDDDMTRVREEGWANV